MGVDVSVGAEVNVSVGTGDGVFVNSNPGILLQAERRINISKAIREKRFIVSS